MEDSNRQFGALAADERKGMGEWAREAWSQALVTVGDAGEEVQKMLGRLTGLVEEGPDEARRLAGELSDKLRAERAVLENNLETAVRRALAPFRLLSRDDLSSVHQRLDGLEQRLDRLVEKRRVARRNVS